MNNISVESLMTIIFFVICSILVLINILYITFKYEKYELKCLDVKTSYIGSLQSIMYEGKFEFPDGHIEEKRTMLKPRIGNETVFIYKNRFVPFRDYILLYIVETVLILLAIFC